jgi:D-galactarolactone isomerase
MSEAPLLRVPTGACDCHMHVYDARFPASPAWPVKPPQAPASDYREVQSALGFTRAVVVQPNAYVDDLHCLEDAMATLGPDVRGIALVRPDVREAELMRLTQAGMRGSRCYLQKGGTVTLEEMEEVAVRIAPYGWHVDVQLDGRDLPRHVARLQALPCDVVIDHVGKFMEPVPPEHPGVLALQRLLDGGRAWVKLSAAYETSRSGPPRYEDVGAIARALVASHPERCIWGSNWPHGGYRPPPSTPALLDLLLEWADDDATRRRILVDNPAALYGFGPSGADAADARQ